MKNMISFLLTSVLIFACISGCGAQEMSPESTDIYATAEPNLTDDMAPAPVSEDAAVVGSAIDEISDDEPTTAEPVDTEWSFGGPSQHGMDAARLANIRQRFAGSQMLAMVIVKDGVIVDEFYKDGYDENSLFRMHSVTKSVMGALIGIAIDKGVIENVDVRLADIYPGLMGNADKEKITIEHLLEHTSGFSEGDSSFMSHIRSENWVERFLSLPLAAKPGTSFFYSTAGSHMLSDILERSAGMSTYDFAMENLFRPLGIESFEWGTDPQGVVDGGNGLSLSVRDAAKFGQLFLEGGNWRGHQLVSQEWVRESIAVHAPGEPDKGRYGYQWWIWSFGGQDVYYALGYAGQFVFVVPELNLVTAIASESIWSDFTGQVCIREIIAACN